ncbi:hypothetical protein [Erythrobacter aurantius]|uniref:hypothetical protein n=1 Tax=Erythrobacter aurantius TaxID=2909249 RepID=UPI00207B0AC1|nr:hypothetical protein [Erythrobacter aurantius]
MLPAAIEEFCETARQNGAPNAAARLVLVAWCSRKRQIRLFHASSMFELGAQMKVQELDYFLGAGDEKLPEAKRAVDALACRRQLCPDAEAVRLIEAQRNAPFVSPVPEIDGLACIGGAIERATVSRDGVRFDTIHRWPDEIGKPLQLAEGLAVA